MCVCLYIFSGAFYLYSGFALLGLIFMVVYVPETKGKTLEEIGTLFKKPVAYR